MRSRFALGISAAVIAFPFSAFALGTNLGAAIDPRQETSCTIDDTTNPARGKGFMTFDDVTDTLTWRITFGTNAPAYDNGLLSGGAENNAHFHGPAIAGQTAGVKVGLSLGSPKIGSASVSLAADQADLLEGEWYINIHSADCSGGEIRGQVIVLQAAPAVQGFGIFALGALILGAAAFAARGEFRST